MRRTCTIERNCVRVAVAMLAETGGAPDDPFVLARQYRIRLHPRERSGAMIRGLHLYYDRDCSREEQARMVAACVATHGLRRHGQRVTPGAVRRVANLITGALGNGRSSASASAASGF